MFQIKTPLKTIGIAATLAFISPSISYAFFCPNNFNQIDFGYSIDQVIAQCGKPDKEEVTEAAPDGPQEWNFYLAQPRTAATNPMTQQKQGTVKALMTFDSDGKLINISIDGNSVGSTTLCNGAVQLGQTRDQVKSSCGSPTVVNTQLSGQTEPPQKKKITTFTYNSTPPGILIFEDGILTKRG